MERYAFKIIIAVIDRIIIMEIFVEFLSNTWSKMLLWFLSTCHDSLLVNKWCNKWHERFSLFWEEISACAAVYVLCYGCMRSCAINNYFASYGGDIIHACCTNKTECQWSEGWITMRILIRRKVYNVKSNIYKDMIYI